MLKRGFGTSLFNMVPKLTIGYARVSSSFGTSLFNMVPKLIQGRQL